MYKNLKLLRESMGMTQKEFAASLSIGLSTYNGYEIGAREPKSDFWISVAKKYGVTIDYLMGFSDDPRQAIDEPKSAPFGHNSFLVSIDEQKHIAKYRSLDDPGKEAVDGVLEVELKRSKESAASEEAKKQLEAENAQLREEASDWRRYLSTPIAARNGDLMKANEEMAKDMALLAKAIKEEDAD